MIRSLLTAASVGALVALPAFAEKHSSGEMPEIGDSGFVTAARAEVTNREGTSVGTVTLNRTESGTTLVIVALTDMPEGAHGIHLHETGDCSADDFTSAGGHIAGEADHGVFAANGPHPGDLPNASVQVDGVLSVEVFNGLLEIDSMVMDEDGAAFIVHAGPDDYITQSAGDAGDRIACGVFEPA